MPSQRVSSSKRRRALAAGIRLHHLVLVGLMLSLTACGRQHAQASASESSAALPPLEFGDDTADLLLTWVDAKGDFHVVQKPVDVPADARGQVRVVVTTRAEGTLDTVYVADLTRKDPQGHYVIRQMPRSDWEKVGADRRKARLEALAPTTATATGTADGAVAAVSSSVVLYGASWCGACRQARQYLEQHGIHVVEKDVESGEAVARELSQKLARAGKPPTNSIPVIDVGGQLLVGFDPHALDQALARLKTQRTL